MCKKSEEWWQQMIDIVVEVFNEIGFEGVFMVEILVCIGGFKVMLYNYFSFKEEIFVEVMIKQVGCQFEELFMVLCNEDEVCVGLLWLVNYYLGVVFWLEIVVVKWLGMYYVGKLELGLFLYECGFKCGWMCIVDFLKVKMDEGKLYVGDFWIVVMQFCVLIEVEWMDVCMFNVVIEILLDQLWILVEWVVEVFFYFYQLC